MCDAAGGRSIIVERSAFDLAYVRSFFVAPGSGCTYGIALGPNGDVFATNLDGYVYRWSATGQFITAHQLPGAGSFARPFARLGS